MVVATCKIKLSVQPLKYFNFVFFPQQKQINTPDLIQYKSFGDRVPAFGTRRKRDRLKYSIEKAEAAIFLTLSLFQSVPKYLCPKCVGATG